jgi:hypothetical protein
MQKFFKQNIQNEGNSESLVCFESKVNQISRVWLVLRAYGYVCELVYGRFWAIVNSRGSRVVTQKLNVIYI